MSKTTIGMQHQSGACWHEVLVMQSNPAVEDLCCGWKTKRSGNIVPYKLNVM